MKKTLSRVLALILALMMMLSLGACSQEIVDKDSSETQATEKTPDKVEDTKSEEDKKAEPEPETEDKDDAPIEVDLKTILLMNPVELGMSQMTFEEAMEKGDAMCLRLEETALNEHRLVIERDNIHEEAYRTTLNGYIAADTLPDFFRTGWLPAETNLMLYQNGKLANLDDVFTYSNGTAYDIYYNDGCLAMNRSSNIMDDGHWYWFNPGNCNHYTLDMNDTIEGGYLMNFGVFTIFPLMIRYDWLKDLGLEIPDSTDSLYEALYAFQTNDANGNGAADERVMFSMGTAEQYWGGISNYFGLHKRWAVNANTGEVMLPELQPGFLPYMEFCKKLYDAKLAYMNEGNCWTYSVDVAGDFCSAHVQYPGELQFPTTGDDDATYVSVPPIQAVADIKPTLTSQDISGSLAAQSFSAKADYDAAARFLDFINSRVYCTSMYYGYEGVAWEIIDGEYVSYDLTEEQQEAGYGSSNRFLYGGYGPGVTLNNLYSPNATYDKGIQEALDNQTTETYWHLVEPDHNAWYQWWSTYCEWLTPETPNNVTVAYQQILDFGPENLLFTACATDHLLAYATLEEAEKVSMYETDLNTFLDELNSNLIMGNLSFDEYEAQIEFAYENLGLQIVIDTYQDRANRALVARGMDPIEK